MISNNLIAETGRCVACGLCLPHCPTYRITMTEGDSPRGRLHLISAVAQGKLPANPRFVEHIGLCLSCRACENACPNGVHYGALADSARALIAQTLPRPGWQRLVQLAGGWILSSRRRSATVGRILRLIQVSGLRRLARLSTRLQKLDALLPSVPLPQSWRNCYPAAIPRGEVCLFLGCVSNMLDSNTLRAAVFVLNRLGYTVHIPPRQTCCGALPRNAGDKAQADALAARNADVFSRHAGLPLLSVASGCGASLHEHVGRPVQDVSAFLAQAGNWESAAITPLDATILVHDSCTLSNVLHQQQPVYELLHRIPGARVLPLPGNDQCCGGAGAYMLTQETMARRLRDDKIQACREAAGTLLATSNIGCALHIAAGLRETGLNVEVAHPVLLLARQMGFNGKL